MATIWARPQVWVPLAVIALLAAIAVAPGAFGAGDPFDCSLSRSLDGPAPGHWFGFDLQGCDYLTHTLLGARASLVIGVTVVAGSTLAGVALGSVAGYAGGLLDAALVRVTDVFFAVPVVLGGMVVLSFLDQRGVVQVAVVLVALGWPPLLRVSRAAVVRAAQAEHVTASRALGASDARLLLRHVLPHAVWPVAVFAAASVGVAISAEALLSFLGVGLQLPAISWGLMLANVRHHVTEAPHLLLPGAFLTVTVGAFVVLSEGLRRALAAETGEAHAGAAEPPRP